MAWFPGAIRKVVVRHRTLMTRHRGICNHVAVSEGASLFGFFNQPGNPTSHFYVRKSGLVEQYVDTQFRAPAQLAGNSSMISIETQGGVSNVNSEPWTDEQVLTLARIWRWAHDVHGIPLTLMSDSRPSTLGIGYHKLGVDPYRVADGELWSSAYGKICPGGGKIAQLPRILTLAQSGADMDLTSQNLEDIADAVLNAPITVGTLIKTVRACLQEASAANDVFAALLDKDDISNAVWEAKTTSPVDGTPQNMRTVVRFAYGSAHAAEQLSVPSADAIAAAVLNKLPTGDAGNLTLDQIKDAVKAALKEGTEA